MRALVTGATGFLGRRLVAALRSEGSEVVVLSRDAGRAQASLGDGVRAFAWDAERVAAPAEAFAQPVDVVFHLAGEPVAEGRWTEARRARIQGSRELGTRHLVAGIAAASARPATLVSASAVGYYGSRGDEVLDENASPGDDFLAEVCVLWEREARAAEDLGVRVVRMRVGVVLGDGGGALEKMLAPFKLGLGGRLGSGQQWMPWVHTDDIVGLALHAAKTGSLAGPMNATAPGPVRNVDFTRALGAALHRPAFLPVPAVALRALFGEFAEVLLASQRVVPRVAEASGYRFRRPALEEALAAALAR